MAVAVIARYPDLTPETYGQVIASLELDANPPAGAILHIAGDSVGGVVAPRSGRPSRRSARSSTTGSGRRSGCTASTGIRSSRSRRCTTSTRSRWTRSSGWAPSRSRRTCGCGALGAPHPHHPLAARRCDQPARQRDPEAVVQPGLECST